MARLFGPDGRHWDEFGVRYPAGADTGARGDVAFFLTSGEHGPDQWLRLDALVAAVGDPGSPDGGRDRVRREANGLEALGYLETGRADGEPLYRPTVAGLLERNRIRSYLHPIPPREGA